MPLKEFEDQMREADGQKVLSLKKAAEWLTEPLTAVDPIVEGIFDVGDKLVVIGSSKSRKTFFKLQLIICLAAGRPFLGWSVPRPRRVLHVQFEVQAHHYQRRLISMCQALGITADDLGDRMHILNARGSGLSGCKAIEEIKTYAEITNPDLITIDPLYKILEGDENSNGRDGMKGTLAAIDELAETFEAAVGYVHHDPKGSVGERAVIDRGAGGGILARDFDSSLVITPHASEDDSYVIELVLRNYRPQEPKVIKWEESDTGAYCFTLSTGIAPTKMTSKTKRVTHLSDYLPIALGILRDEMSITDFKAEFKARSGLGDNRIRDFVNWATAGNSPPLITREERGNRRHEKWIRQR